MTYSANDEPRRTKDAQLTKPTPAIERNPQLYNSLGRRRACGSHRQKRGIFVVDRHEWLSDRPVFPGEGREFALTLSQNDFNALVQDHGASMYRIAYRMVGDRHEAEDVVQDTFRSAWKSRRNYQSGRGDRAWLASILRRRVIDRWRKKSPPSVVSSDAAFDVGVAGDDPLANEFTDEMQYALSQLPSELRETLLLVVVGELTHQEVANLLDIPLGTVLSRVSRARKRLRESLTAIAKK